MGALEPGGGVSAAALVGMWRSVYRKAAEAAEARLQALLAQHVGERHGRRAVAVVIDGGGEPLQPGLRCDLELPWAYAVEGWALYADQPGDVVVDLLLAPTLADFPGTASICGGAPPTLAGGQQAHHEGLAGWTTALPRGSILRVVVASATDLTLVTLTLLVRAV